MPGQCAYTQATLEVYSYTSKVSRTLLKSLKRLTRPALNGCQKSRIFSLKMQCTVQGNCRLDFASAIFRMQVLFHLIFSKRTCALILHGQFYLTLTSNFLSFLKFLSWQRNFNFMRNFFFFLLWKNRLLFLTKGSTKKKF